MEIPLPENDIIKILEHSWIFRNFPAKDMKELAVNSSLVHYNNRDILFKQKTRTSHVMYIVNGLVKIYKELQLVKVLAQQYTYLQELVLTGM